MTDLFVLLASPGGGDELQGIKRGVMELADLLLVTKADGDLLAAANRAAAEYQAALHLMRPKHPGLQPKVMTVSSIARHGIVEAWNEIAAIHGKLGQGMERLRADQARRWFWNEVQTVLSEAILADPRLAGRVDALEGAVTRGGALPHNPPRGLGAPFRGS